MRSIILLLAGAISFSALACELSDESVRKERELESKIIANPALENTLNSLGELSGCDRFYFLDKISEKKALSLSFAELGEVLEMVNLRDRLPVFTQQNHISEDAKISIDELGAFLELFYSDDQGVASVQLFMRDRVEGEPTTQKIISAASSFEPRKKVVFYKYLYTSTNSISLTAQDIIDLYKSIDRPVVAADFISGLKNSGRLDAFTRNEKLQIVKHMTNQYDRVEVSRIILN